MPQDEIQEIEAPELSEEEVEEPIEEVEEESSKEEKSDEEPSEESEEVEEKEEEEEEVEEEKEEVKEEEEEEKEEELPSPYHRSSYQEIKTKYPSFFKDFPDAKTALFRERKFTSMFPTVEDAEEAFNKSEALDGLERSLLSGNVTDLLDALDKSDKKASEKIIDNFLPQVYARSKDLWYKTVNPVVENVVKNVFIEGERTNNENLKAAAMYFSQFLWGHTEPKELGIQQREDPRIKEKEEALDKERQRIENQQYEQAYNDVTHRTNRYLISEISKHVTGIKDEYKRNSATRDIYSKVNEVLAQDSRHMSLMNSLWRKSQKSGFSPEWRGRLVSTFLVRAKQVLPAIRKEIMTQIEKPQPKKKEEVVKAKQKPVGGTAKPTSSKQSIPEKKGKIDWDSYQSDSDFLADFVDHKGRVKRTT